MAGLANFFGQWILDYRGIDLLLLFLLIFTRFVAMSLMMPILGAQILPSMVRVGLSLVLAAAVFFSLLAQADGLFQLSAFWIAMLFFKEALLGFILGLLASLIFFTYELVGEIIDLARAANMAKLLVPELRHTASPVATMFFQLALAVSCALGLHRPIIANIYNSFTAFPVNYFYGHLFAGDLRLSAFAILQTMFKIALELSLPVVFMSFLVDLAFGLMNRAAPQINAYFLSLPAKMVGGLLILLFTIPFLVDDFPSSYHTLTEFFRRTVSQ